MKPSNLKTQIFLDSGDPGETKIALELLGFLDGQTTNPSYYAKSPKVQEYLKTIGKFSKQELLLSYRRTIEAVAALIPKGSVSIEVYADKNIKAEEMLAQAKEMFKWTPNAYIKFPIIPEGMKAAQKALEEGMRVNMTLCFNQQQAAAVYAMSKGAKRGQIYISPFIGRHTDAGTQGLDLVRNIIRMYKAGDRHILVLAASLRAIEQFYAVIFEGADIITAGFKYLKQWSEEGLKLPGGNFVYNPEGFKPIVYEEYDLDKNWTSFNISDKLTSKGLDQFSQDWNNLIA